MNLNVTNQLYYGDNLDVLRSQILGASVDLVYLDPPFNSNQDYSVIFKNTKGKGSEAQIKAFKDTWGDFSKIQIMTIEQLLRGDKIKMPPTTVAETFSSPGKESKKPDAQQGILL